MPSVHPTAWIALCVAACASEPSANRRTLPQPQDVEPVTPPAAIPQPAPVLTIEAAPPSVPPAWLDAREVASNGGTYLVRWKALPAEIPRGPLFSIEAWVFEAASPEQALSNVALSVDAAMPEHLHGMNRVPTIEKSGDRFRIDGMKLHMPGNWELYFDVTRGAITERAQVRFELE